MSDAFYCICSFAFSHKPNFHSIIISSNSTNHNFIKDHRFLYHVMKNVRYFWFKSKIFPKKVPVLTNNILTRAITFIGVFVFWGITSICNRVISTNIYLKKLWTVFVALMEKGSNIFLCYPILVLCSKVNHHLKWIGFSTSLFTTLLGLPKSPGTVLIIYLHPLI